MPNDHLLQNNHLTLPLSVHHKTQNTKHKQETQSMNSPPVVTSVPTLAPVPVPVDVSTSEEMKNVGHRQHQHHHHHHSKQRIQPPAESKFVRADLELFEPGAKDKHNLHGNALYDTLSGDGMVEIYEIYKRIAEDDVNENKNTNTSMGTDITNEVQCIVKLGNKLNGYPGITHGGITALLFDHTFGWVFIAFKAPPSVTANLNINYRRPVFADTWVKITAKLEKVEGRKLHMTAHMTDAEGNTLADASALFIAPKRKGVDGEDQTQKQPSHEPAATA